MPINAALLEWIKKDDPSLKILVLNNEKLNDSDIQQLVNALTTNTTLTALNVAGNELGNEGAKALAANTTLTTLNVGDNWIGAEGAKALAANTTLTSMNVVDNQVSDEGAKALAANSTLTSLNVGFNQIGDEGAKALAANMTLTTLDITGNKLGTEGAKALVTNTTLTTLDIDFNRIGDEAKEQLEQAIVRNNQQLISRRNQFIRTLIILAYDKANSASQSLWSRLPQELMLYIISLMDFRSGSIGKNAQQIKCCAAFMFTQVADLKGALRKAIKTEQSFEIIEKRAQGKSQFHFFPPPALIKTIEECHGNPHTIRETL